MGGLKLSPPAPLHHMHILDSFDCLEPSLNKWLRRRARANDLTGASRTYVVCFRTEVVGYYCLSSGALAASAAPGTLRRNMPDPIPMAILGRLAVDRRWQGKGLASRCFRMPHGARLLRQIFWASEEFSFTRCRSMRGSSTNGTASKGREMHR